MLGQNYMTCRNFPTLKKSWKIYNHSEMKAAVFAVAFLLGKEMFSSNGSYDIMVKEWEGVSMKITRMVGLLLAFVLVLTGCNTKPTSIEEEAQTSDFVEEVVELPDSESSLTWEGLSRDGIDETVFWKTVNEENLKTVALEFQDLTDFIGEKSRKNPEYARTAEWFNDVKNSDEYARVLAMGDGAVKPLYWIIYKSEQQGLYEYICAMALDELTGYDYSTVNEGNGWSTSKELLELLNDKILEESENKDQ